MKTNFTKVLAVLLTGAMALSFVACGGGETAETTTAATTPAPNLPTINPDASANKKVESDYEVVCDASTLNVQTGTSKDDIIAQLPTEVTVKVSGEATGEATTLLDEKFESADSFAENWTMCDADGVATVGDGKFVSGAASNRLKAYVTDPEWAKLDTEEYANYVISAKFTGTADAPTNNFGIIFRATDVTDAGPDSYSGMYVGIGDAAGQIMVGKAQNNWTQVATVDFDYQPNVEYTLTVVVYNEKFAVLLDGVVMYEGEVDATMVNGTVGIRTFEQLFEVSSYTVSTLGASDFDAFEGGFTENKVLPVTWSCSDYDADKPGRYGFFGDVTEGLPEGKKAQVKVTVTVRSAS